MNEYENIYAKVIKENNKLKIGKRYKVKRIIMGQSHTAVVLNSDNTYHNSIIFDFYDGDNKINIYRDSRFNPYMNLRKGKV